MEMLSGILSIIKELKNIIVMALDFIPKLHDKKKRKRQNSLCPNQHK